MSWLFEIEEFCDHSECLAIHHEVVGLVGFYGISTIVGYLMPNPIFTYILNI